MVKERIARRRSARVARRHERHELKDIGYEIFVGAVSVLSILNLLLMYVVSDPSLDTVLLVMNVVLTVILFIDFVYRLVTAPSPSGYFFRQFGWADLLASLPVQQLKLLRVFRLARVFRLLRQNGIRVIGNRLLRNRAGSALLTLLLLGILVLEFGSLWMLALEQNAPDANITTASDAIWYVVVTISTVGYGDQFPVTTEGRVLGAAIIVVGVGIFGTFTGYLANLFLAPKPPLEVPVEPAEEAEVAKEAVAVAEDTRERVDHLRELLTQQQAAIEELDSLLTRQPPPSAG
jgi:voltage-gated potassium channel